MTLLKKFLPSYEEGEIFIEIVDIYVIYRLYHKIGAYERFIL